MDLTSFISTISVVLWPIKWVIELLLVGFHTALVGIGMDPAAGARNLGTGQEIQPT